MKTPKNRRRAPTLLLAAAAALTAMTNERSAAGQTPTPTPVKSWTQISVLVRNTVAAVKRDLAEMAGEFPQLGALAREAKTGADSLSYTKDGVRIIVEFRHPLARAEAEAPDTSWRVYRLKDGKLLGARSHVSAAVYGRGSAFERRVSAVIRAKEAELLDHAGADTRGSTRDLGAVPFEGTLEEGGRYRAEIVYDAKESGWRTAEPLRMPHHHYGRVEWLNAGHFPGLYFGRPPGARVEVVFEVVGKQVLRRSERTWTTEYKCLIIGVEGREPPRAEFLTLVAACLRVRASGKRNAGLYFTFDVRRVVVGAFAAKEFTVELTGERGAFDLLGAVGGGGGELWPSEGTCDPSKEVELTFEVTDAERPPRAPGVLQEFRVIE